MGSLHIIYGYRRQAEDKNRLEPDPDTAGVVKQIFCWAAAGWGATAIARRLEEMGVAGPTHNAPWSSAMVRRILTNPTYCGCLTQNRSRKVSYKVEKSRPLPPEEWITVEGTHPAIVSPTLFQAVQSSRRQTVRHPLAGKAWCALCGAAMTFTTDGARRYLVCSGRRKGTGCFSAFAAGRSCGAGGVALFEGRVGCGSPGDRRRDMQEAAGKLACRGGGTGKAAGRQPPAVGAGSCPRTGLLALEPGKAPPKPTK